MMLAEKETAAEALFRAAEQREAIAPLRESWPTLTIDDAYHIQRINHVRQMANGARRVGCKIGLTSPAVQQQLGVDQPDFGVLFNTMCYGDAEPIPASKLAQPKVEAEIAFVLKDDLAMDAPTLQDVIRAIDYALPAVEVVDSRIRHWDISIVDTIADNASSGVFVLGSTPKLLSEFDLRLCGMVMARRGEIVSTGAGSACLGHPLNAVVWLARTMARVGTPLKAGDIVLSGALGPMASVAAGDTIEARINGLGSVRACFAPSSNEEQA